MATDKIQLEIVTPERRVVHESVDEVVLPGIEGYFGVLPGHAPFLTALGVGEITYRIAGRSVHLAVASGYCEVLRDRVSVLAENCERADEIDVTRAREDKRRWEQALKQDLGSDHELRRAEIRLKKALTRLEVASRVQ